MEFLALAVLEEEHGILNQINVYVHLETGMAFHVFLAQLDNNGIHQITHVHAQPTLIGTVLTV